MRILVGCEFSQTVTKAFRLRGHEAFSCDILPTDGNPAWHIQCNINDILTQGWDMMIAFPPCTHLASSGARWFREKRADGRQQAGIDFFMLLAGAPIPRIAIENPVGIMSSVWRKPDQIIHPWQFGHAETKATCLWLKNLPALRPTEIVVPEWALNPDGTPHLSGKGKRDNPTHFYTGRVRVLKGIQKEQWERIHRLPPSGDRWKIRSITYEGIARAMAEQWS